MPKSRWVIDAQARQGSGSAREPTTHLQALGARVNKITCCTCSWKILHGYTDRICVWNVPTHHFCCHVATTSDSRLRHQSLHQDDAMRQQDAALLLTRDWYHRDLRQQPTPKMSSLTELVMSRWWTRLCWSPCCPQPCLYR